MWQTVNMNEAPKDETEQYKQEIDRGKYFWFDGSQITVHGCTKWNQIGASRIDKVFKTLEGNKFWEITVINKISVQ